ncbi:ABC transporter substrate-binding protein [Dorea sp. AM10-31]|uniref:ABC transporter substrate-binding protein n=1 Tax=Dorea sp. AM10-31 TaxID=2293098 RepID=UPI000E3FE615|nr:ABC transporter substrate-binding protein [Dorea sp. AM10-31]RGF22209.1 carbohydrate ABC transporter substrate-binding protein [Dorea sp. AM10-31]
MQKTKCYLAALVSGVLLVTGILAGCGQSKKDDHLTVYLWENRLMKNIAPYIHEQFPDQDIEFIIGNNDTDLYSYFKEQGELPDIMTVRRFSGTDAQDLQPYLMDFASYDVVSKYYSYAVEYYKNTDDEIQWLPICALPQTIIANKTLFDQYGIKVPENYEEYVQVCQQFYDKGIKPYSMDLAEDWSNQEIIQAAAIGEFTSLDGIDWRNKAETSAGEIKFDDVLWKRIFSETSQFLKDSHFSEEDINVNSNTGTQMFVEGKSAMFHGQPTDMQKLQDQMDAELIRIPYFSQTSDSSFVYMFPSLNIAFNKELEKNQEKLDTALDVLDCMNSEQGQKLIADGSGVISFNTDVPSMMQNVPGLEEEIKDTSIYIRYSAQKSFDASLEAVHGLLSGKMDEMQAYNAFRSAMNSKDSKEKSTVNFENEYSISLNDKSGRDAASSILTTIREENDAQLALTPYYYYTSSIYKGECTSSRVGLMTAKNSDTPLYLVKLNGEQVYELVKKYLTEADENFYVTTKYELPIASGMKIIVKNEENGFSLKDITINDKKIDTEKEYSILLTDTTKSILKKINPKCAIEQIEDTTLSSAWIAAMSNGQQPSAPEDYIEVEK